MIRPRAWQSQGSWGCLRRKLKRRQATGPHEHLPEVAGLEDTPRQLQLHRDRQSQSSWQRLTVRLQGRPGHSSLSDASQSRFHQGHLRRSIHLDHVLRCWRHHCSQAPLLKDQPHHRSRRCLTRWRRHKTLNQLPLPSRQFHCLAQDHVQCVAGSQCRTMLSLTPAQTQVDLIKAKATNPCGYSLIRPFAVNLAVEICSSHLGGGKYHGRQRRHHQAPALECHLAQLMAGHVTIASRVQMEMGVTAKQSGCSMRYKS